MLIHDRCKGLWFSELGNGDLLFAFREIWKIEATGLCVSFLQRLAGVHQVGASAAKVSTA